MTSGPTTPDEQNRLVGLSLRRAGTTDASRILQWRSEPSAGRYQPLRLMTSVELRQTLEAEASLPLDGRFSGTARFIVETAAGPAGWITLREVNREHRRGDIGYTIGEAFRGRGIASAAVQALLTIAFEGVDLDRLGAVAVVENAASRRVLERAGFRLEGIARAYLVIDGHRIDHACYGLLRDEWERGRRADQLSPRSQDD